MNVIAAIALSLTTAIAHAQDFSMLPLRLITIFAAGSAADQHARYLASKVSEQRSACRYRISSATIKPQG